MALRNGALDIAVFAGEASLANFAVLPLWSERILVALPETHSLASRNSAYWTDLREETILLTQCDPGRELEDLLIAKLASPSDRPTINRQNVSRGIIKSLIGAGFGVSLVTESDVRVSFAGLTYREVRGWNRSIPGRFYGALARGQYQSSAGKLLGTIGRTLSFASQRLTCTTRLCKRPIGCHKPRQHGRN